MTSYAIPGSASQHARLQLLAYALQFAGGRQKLATLFSYQIGANDVLRNFDTLAKAPPGTNRAVDGIIDRLIQNFGNDVLLMFLTHPNGSGAIDPPPIQDSLVGFLVQ